MLSPRVGDFFSQRHAMLSSRTSPQKLLPEKRVPAASRDDGHLPKTGHLPRTGARISPCFTPGTQIVTQHGEISAEKLRVGDRVITRDNGLQEIRWIGKVRMRVQDFQAFPHLLPVLIRQGALGRGLPERDLLVSPNHRILVAADRTARLFREPEVLVAARHLTSGQAVKTVESSGTTYIHLLFDRHEVVLSNGAWTESFQPNDHSLRSVGNAQRIEIMDIFPDLNPVSQYAPARRTLGREFARIMNWQ